MIYASSPRPTWRREFIRSTCNGTPSAAAIAAALIVVAVGQVIPILGRVIGAVAIAVVLVGGPG
jgi:hypothetical protein